MKYERIAKMKTKAVSIVTLLSIAVMLALTGCEEPNYPDNIYDPNDPGNPTPVITSVSPADSTYGSIMDKKTVVIEGQNFSATANENLVYFGAAAATVITATTTRLELEPPANFGDSLKVKVDARGAYLFGEYRNVDSSWHYYKLLNPVEKPGDPAFALADNMSVMDMGADGNLYVVSGIDIIQVTPDGIRKVIGPTKTANALSNMRCGSEFQFHYTYSNYYFVTTVDTASGTSTHANFKTSKKVADLDFDMNRNVWYAGEDGVIYVTKAGEVAGTLLYKNDAVYFTKMRHFENYLYLAGKETLSDGSEVTKIWKQQIDLTAGAPALKDSLIELFNWTESAYVGKAITVLELNADGEVYVGSSAQPLMKLNLTTGIGQTVYPKLLNNYKTARFVWGANDYIYINTLSLDAVDNDTILKVRLFEEGAPYYGRQ